VKKSVLDPVEPGGHAHFWNAAYFPYIIASVAVLFLVLIVASVSIFPRFLVFLLDFA